MNNYSAKNDAMEAAKLIASDAAQPLQSEVPISELATRLDLKPVKVKGSIEYHGANPIEPGAEQDGFILFAEGNAHDRKLGRNYKRGEVLHAAGITPVFQRSTRLDSGNSRSKQSPTSYPKTVFDWASATISDYKNRMDDLLYQVGRVDTPTGKEIRQRRPDGSGGWINNLAGVETVLYHLSAVLAADTVYICEGEKATDALNSELKKGGLYGSHVATTNSMGAGKWRESYSETLSGKHAVVLPDNDEIGRRHAAIIVQSLVGKAASIKVVELEGLPEKGDTVEYFENRTLHEFVQAVNNTPEIPHPTPRFRLVSIPDLLTRPDPTWLIHGVLQSGTNSCLSAAHASFKSFLALDMALSVATGRQWCGRDVIQGNIIYVCAEGASGMKARVLAWCHDKGVEPPANFYFIDDAVQAHESKDREALQKALGEMKPVLIILDTLSLCALGLEENAAKDMNQFMDGVKKIQDTTGAHVLLVHHHSKLGGSRGSTAIPAAVQSEFELKRERESATLSCLKQKDGPEFKPLMFKSRLVEYDTWRRKSSLVLDFQGDSESTDSLTGTEQRVYELLVECFGAAGASSSAWWAVAEENKIVKGSFYRAQRNLVDKGKVDDGKNGKGGRGATYRPTELIETKDESLKVSMSLNETHETQVNQKVSQSQ